MPNPLGSIIPVLKLLGEKVKILTATGGAVEDMQPPDQEEIEDLVVASKTKSGHFGYLVG
jgi:hypothetical protein